MRYLLYIFTFFSFVVVPYSAYAGNDIVPNPPHVDEEIQVNCTGDDLTYVVYDSSDTPYLAGLCNTNFALGDEYLAYSPFYIAYYPTDDWFFTWPDTQPSPFNETNRWTFELLPTPAPPVTNHLWRSDNGFWGSTTIDDVTGSLTASVQATGADIWPLFRVVGIPIACLIALALIGFLYQAIYIPKTAKRGGKEIVNPNSPDLIYHDAKTLEFMRTYPHDKE